MRRYAIAGTLAALLLGACGTGGGPTPSAPVGAEAAGACPGRSGSAGLSVAGDWVDASKAWVEFRAGGHRPAERERRLGDVVVPASSLVDVEVVRVVRGAPGIDAGSAGTVQMESATAGLLDAEQRAGATLVASLRGNGNGGHFADYVATLRPDGSVVFLGRCAYERATKPLAAFAAARAAGGDARPAREVWLALVERPDGPDARAFVRAVHPEPPSWGELPPERRTVGEGADPPPPRDVLATLVRVELTLAVPREWRAFPYLVCPRLSIAWSSPCVRLDLAGTAELRVAARMREGEDLALWLTGAEGSYESAIGRIGRVPARLRAEGATITLTGDPSIRTADALLAAARESRQVLRVA
jgi:hypothetical protein